MADRGKGRLARAGRAALLPFWLAQLGTGAKSFADNPVLGSPWLNERGLHALRLKVAHAMAARRRQRLESLVAATDRADFARDGFVMKRDFLPAARFAALRREVAAYRGAAREQVQGDTVTRRIALDPAALAHLPETAALLAMPAWRDTIRYVGSSLAQPVHYLQTILTHARPDTPDPQTELHADTFHPTVKAWLFLTDVAADAAPFTYVAGSHRLSPARLAWEWRRSVAARHAADRPSRRGSLRIGTAELAGLGLPLPTVFAVPANTLIVADTFGFHARGSSAAPTRRVEIWAYGRRNPFLPWTGLDPWALKALEHRRASLAWQIADQAEAWGLFRNVWRPVPPHSALDGLTAETHCRHI